MCCDCRCSGTISSSVDVVGSLPVSVLPIGFCSVLTATVLDLQVVRGCRSHIGLSGDKQRTINNNEQSDEKSSITLVLSLK